MRPLLPAGFLTVRFVLRLASILLLTILTVAFLASSLMAPSTIWRTTSLPGVADAGSDKPVELGVKFRSDAGGVISGIRFYKARANTGMHVGNLWTNTGRLLATGTFTDETATGWQQLNLTPPVAIAPNTVYVASYHSDNGHHGADINWFSTKGVDNPPLHAIANGVHGGNGVYAFGNKSAFPDQTRDSTNYWVDVVFQVGSQFETTLPDMDSVIPSSGASGVSIDKAITCNFTKAMDEATMNANTIILRDSSNASVPGSVVYNAATHSASVIPSNLLKVAKIYTVTVKGGASGVADMVGNPMRTDHVWTFATVTYGAKGGGPGGPILVLADRGNPFSEYYAEILLAEGLNEFSIKPISSVSRATLAQYDIVILGEVALTASQAAMLGDWVDAGGRLIAMRPDKQLAGLLGLVESGSSIAQGYLLVNTGSGPGMGIVGQTMQFHGTADCYSLAGASSVATLYSDARTPTASPAVTLRHVGSNGGMAAAFTFDLARSIVFTRQGNPEWVGQNRNGLTPKRSSNLFYGPASFDPRPNWIDLTKVAVPQADEQQRLLANMIVSMESDKKLLPRFWYFPHEYRSVVVMTGDDHASGGTAGRFDHYLALSASNGSVDDWETIRGSSYIFCNAKLSDRQAAAYNAAGFEVALHLNTNCADYTRESLETMFTEQLKRFTCTYPSLPPMTTHRVHCVAWSDYTTLAEIELVHGIRLDTSYYYWPMYWIANRPGVFTGSAMPMRFATAEGNTIDVYQATTQMTDESGQSYPYTVDALLDKAVGPEGYYGAYVANMHTDSVSSAGSDAILASARSRGVPVISARQLLKWTDARNSSSFGSVAWTSSGTMTFVVDASPNARGLQAMAPILKGYKVDELKYNGCPIRYSLKGIKGIHYAIFPALSGSYQISYAPDCIAPVITSITPSPDGAGVSTGTEVRIAFNKAMDEESINSSTVTLRDSSNALVPATISYDNTAFGVVLIPKGRLTGSKNYRVTVKGGTAGAIDLAGNPLVRDFASSFTTRSASSELYSVWNDTVTPGIPSSDDTTAVEVGMKFKSAIDGCIKMIRFYKGAGNQGKHIGNLWTADGNRLATVTFSDETESGWQSQALSSPVPVKANTTYVVSYFSPAGRYSANVAYFWDSGVDNYPLHALANGESGHNGVFRYGKRSAFPDQACNANNYWVDVVFGLGGPGSAAAP